MPTTPAQAHEHKHGLSDAQARQWAEVANSVREKCIADGGTESVCDARAIRQANGVVGNVDNMNKLTCHKLQLSNYEIRRTQYEGRDHIVVPAVLFVEGVHHGSAGPILYTAEELEKYPAAWNGRPVPIFHPQDGEGTPISCNDPQTIQSRSVGNLFNVYFEDGKLKGEVWIDEDRIKQISPTALSYIQTGRCLEVSTGVFSDEDPVSGEWNGEQYTSIARNLRPDHLALLPGEKGACSWEDGCGIRSNQKEVINVSDDKPDKTVVVPEPDKIVIDNTDPPEKGLKALFTRVYEKLSSVFGELKAQEMSYSDIITRLQASLDSMDSPTAINYIKAVYDDYFIYEVRPGEQARGAETKMYKREYTINDNGEIEMEDELIPVVQQPPEYIAVQAESSINNEKDGETTMTQEKTGCPEKVTQLIENDASKFDETDREWLETLTEAQVDKLTPEVVEPIVNEDKTEVKIEKETKVKSDKIAPVTFKDLLDTADPKLKEKLEYGFTTYDARKTELIAAITANEASDYTADELDTMSITALEKLGKLAGCAVKANYEGRIGNISVQVNDTDTGKVKPMPALGFSHNKKK